MEHIIATISFPPCLSVAEGDAQILLGALKNWEPNFKFTSEVDKEKKVVRVKVNCASGEMANAVRCWAAGFLASRNLWER
jgi:hypothetical protein